MGRLGVDLGDGLFQRHGGKVLLHQLVNKAIAPPDSLKQKALGAVVEEAGIVPGYVACAVEHNSERNMLNAGDEALINARK